MTPAVELHDVSFGYDGASVIEGANLLVKPGEFVTVVGPNGGGKTTLLKLILGLHHPDAGSVRVFGKRPEESRPRIGYVPQYSKADPIFPATVLDVVLMGRLGRTRTLGSYSRPDIDVSLKSLADVELSDLRDRPFSNLSGGQTQRALIARALASEPDLLLLDEPTANLDIAMENELYEIIQSLKRRLTVLLASHDLAFVSGFTDTVACVNRRVAVHITSEVTPDLINRLYGREVRFVRHDHFPGETT
ncbi:MAG: ABC transporter ATP-binding protein [Candidatus Eisenbacteria bacterium]|nr:ABC transporter ATP-binding protein [Candidatus Eisenbacteria bacterium]